MTNVSWYGGASVRGQTWPINEQNATTKLFTVSDLKDNPSGYGSALERYFLGSSGKRSAPARVVYQLLRSRVSLAEAAGHRSPSHLQVCYGKPVQIFKLTAAQLLCYVYLFIAGI